MVTYTRRLILFAIDIILVNIALLMALVIRFETRIPSHYILVFLKSFLILTAVKIVLFYLFGLYRSLWRYASIDELLKVVGAATLGSILEYFICIGLKYDFPRSVQAISWMLTIMLVGGARLAYRVIRRFMQFKKKDSTSLKRVMIVGAGDAASMVIKELQNHEDGSYVPVVAVDDARWKRNTKIHDVPVRWGTHSIKEIAEEKKIDQIIIAMPSAGKKRVAEILKICQKTKCKLKTLPGIYEIIDNKVTIKKIRDVSIEDLLGREEVKLNTAEIAGYLDGETILVTGGGGSIGSELCRQIARFNPKKLVIVDAYENNAYELQNELKYNFKSLDLEVAIASVRDKKRIKELFDKFKPSVVFHAAAHKHVPLMEASPAEAIKNNVLGTLNTAQCADECGVRRFVLISTDKAVNPTNIMGASKRVAEMIIQSIDKISPTEFVAVRFGNVLDSNGSVIPLFKKQISRGGPVTVTHPEINRFFMTIPEASRLVIQAGAIAKGGEIFVLDMGEPVKIDDLARHLIRLSGFEPDVDMKIEYSGLRPGEKLYEELLLDEEGIESTKQQGIFIAKPSEVTYKEMLIWVKALENSIRDIKELKECIARIVPTYSYTKIEAKVVAMKEIKQEEIQEIQVIALTEGMQLAARSI